MTSPILRQLSSDVFSDGIGFVLPPGPMRRRLQLSADVRAVESALRYGQVTDAAIRQFVYGDVQGKGHRQVASLFGRADVEQYRALACLPLKELGRRQFVLGGTPEA